MKKETLLDLFCGAGGFTEGFRQAGFKPVLGVDHWSPATTTYRANQNSKSLQADIKRLSENIESINELPDTTIILGSPPCVSFSNSNKSGYADKSLGLSLTKAFFKIVAVKLHQPNSILKAWVMENVPNVQKYINGRYTFFSLGLSDWAKEHGIAPQKIAIDIRGKSQILNSEEDGVCQRRKRIFVVGLANGEFDFEFQSSHIPPSLGEVLDELGSPFEPNRKGKVKDPHFEGLSINRNKLTDHFYDTGIPFRYWMESKYLKQNHPYMGKMSFPEKVDSTARTVVASPFARSRESMIFKCELPRKGDGEYRSPTIREAATLMSFSIDYLFYGSELQKWKLVGNAVCTVQARNIALALRNQLNMRPQLKTASIKRRQNKNFLDLNSNKQKEFDLTPRRKIGTKFRRHTFKLSNMTVALTNYDLTGKKDQFSWGVFATYGISKSHLIERLETKYLPKIRRVIESCKITGTKEALNKIDLHIEKHVPKSPDILQQAYEQGEDYLCPNNPVTILENYRTTIDTHVNGALIPTGELPFKKDEIPLKQLLSTYALLKTVDSMEEICQSRLQSEQHIYDD